MAEEKSKEEGKVFHSGDSSAIATIMYWDLFKRRLSLYLVFFTKYGIWLLVIFMYMYYVKEVSFIKAGAFLILGIMFIGKFLLKDLYYKKYDIFFYNIKNKIVKRKMQIDRSKQNNKKADKRFF